MLGESLNTTKGPGVVVGTHEVGGYKTLIVASKATGRDGEYEFYDRIPLSEIVDGEHVPPPVEAKAEDVAAANGASVADPQ